MKTSIYRHLLYDAEGNYYTLDGKPAPRRITEKGEQFRAKSKNGRTVYLDCHKVRLADLSGVKVCYRCKTAKPLTQYYNNPRQRDGRGSNCIECLTAEKTPRTRLLDDSARGARERNQKAIKDCLKPLPVLFPEVMGK